MSQEVQPTEFNHLMWVLTSHSRIMYVNSSYNIYVRELIVQHLDANLGLHVDGKLKAGERRVLTTNG